MNEMMDQILELSAEGLCCAQILMKIVGMANSEEENPALLKAMGGLGYGAYTQQTCGALTGAACALALYTETRPEAAELIKELTAWFTERFSSCKCEDILGKGCSPAPICKTIMEETIYKCFEILENHGLLS